MSNKNTSIARSYFTTENLKPSERYAAWRDGIGVIMDYERDERDELEGFNASLESYLIGDFMSADCITKRGVWRRKSQSIAQDQIDMYLIQIFLEGTWEHEQFNSSRTAQTGSIVILDMAQTKKTYTSDFRNLSLCVPRHLLAPLLDFPNDHNCRILKPNHPLTMLLKSHLLTLHEQAPQITLDEAYGLSKPTLELIATVLNASCGDETLHSSETLNRAKINHLKRYIEINLHRPELTSDYISKELCISRASLYRIAAPLGGVQNFIRKRRLLRCYKELLNPAFKHFSILQIGLNWGFSDASSFSRAFKAEFGITPSELRNENQQSTTFFGATFIDPNVGDRQFTQWLAEYI